MRKNDTSKTMEKTHGTYNKFKRMTSGIRCIHSYPSATKDKHVHSSLWYARACNTHLRWGFSSYILSAMNSCHDRGRCLPFFNNALNHHLAMETAAMFTSGIEKTFLLTRIHQTFSFCQNCSGIMTPPWLDTSGCFKQMALYPLRGMNCRDTRLTFSRVFWLFAMISSKSCKVFNIFLKTTYHIIVIKSFKKICIYLEPQWLLFLKVNPSKQGLFQSKQGSFGFQVYKYNMMSSNKKQWKGWPSRVGICKLFICETTTDTFTRHAVNRIWQAWGQTVGWVASVLHGCKIWCQNQNALYKSFAVCDQVAPQQVAVIFHPIFFWTKGATHQLEVYTLGKLMYNSETWIIRVFCGNTLKNHPFGVTLAEVGRICPEKE